MTINGSGAVTKSSGFMAISGNATKTAIAAGSDGYGVVWLEQSQQGNMAPYVGVWKSGSLAGGPTALTNGTLATNTPRIVWTGTDYVMAWEQDTANGPRVAFRRIGADASLGANGLLTDQSQTDPDIAWSANGLLLLSNANGTMTMTRFDTLLLNPSVVATFGAGQSPRLAAASDTSFGVTWSDGALVFAARVDTNGATQTATTGGIGTPANAASSPQIVWTGTAWNLVWEDGPTPGRELFFDALACP